MEESSWQRSPATGCHPLQGSTPNATSSHGLLGSSLAPWIRSAPGGAWLHPPANRPGLAGARGHDAGCSSLVLTVAGGRRAPGTGCPLPRVAFGALGTPWHRSCCPEPDEHGRFRSLPAPRPPSPTLGRWHVPQAPPLHVSCPRPCLSRDGCGRSASNPRCPGGGGRASGALQEV